MEVLLFFFAFLKLSSSILINCEFKNDYIHEWSLRYSCQTKKIVIKSDDEKIKAIAGDHLKEMTRENVTQYFARGLNIEKFPQGLVEFFVNLEVVRITSCNMIYLLKEDMENLDKLKFLDLVGNKIEKLNSNVFENIPNIVEVILNNNRLKFIGSEILKPLGKLKIISFGGNVCIQSFAKHSEEQLKRLKSDIVLKCSDITMADLMKRFGDLEDKMVEVLKKLDYGKTKKRYDDDFVVREGNFVVKLNNNMRN